MLEVEVIEHAGERPRLWTQLAPMGYGTVATTGAGAPMRASSSVCSDARTGPVAGMSRRYKITRALA
jgi:hypothetical protein